MYDNSSEKMQKDLNFDIAYNSTLGTSEDYYETYLQIDEEKPGFFDDLRSFWGRFVTNGVIDDVEEQIADAKLHEEMVRQVHDADLEVQITNYESSINNGHAIAVISHSQGNLFTNEAYAAVTAGDKNAWRKKYFKAFAVATAATKLLEEKQYNPSIVFDNDPLSRMATYFGFKKTYNPNRYQEQKKDQWGDLNYYDNTNALFHSFKYYMGEPIQYTDGHGDHNVSTNIAKDQILGFIEDSVVKR